MTLSLCCSVLPVGTAPNAISDSLSSVLMRLQRFSRHTSSLQPHPRIAHASRKQPDPLYRSLWIAPSPHIHPAGPVFCAFRALGSADTTSRTLSVNAALYTCPPAHPSAEPRTVSPPPPHGTIQPRSFSISFQRTSTSPVALRAPLPLSELVYITSYTRTFLLPPRRPHNIPFRLQNLLFVPSRPP
ncbi:hypothetical protein HYPSUDRAFT_201366 [Hypholoma sublateritium FD-334 SS-4]|uniref:Uncharacterized protein n=1 Tax=Hypholoma sublateritium (strain FD-334 SS-4) TaxID=945553 RepID=A0A0D2NX22_HYPSF|nr:hypothetical protein HYPSUDRAFT_201366 [Hypholoma sublateritium FD-334 SS-4]